MGAARQALALGRASGSSTACSKSMWPAASLAAGGQPAQSTGAPALDGDERVRPFVAEAFFNQHVQLLFVAERRRIPVGRRVRLAS